MRLATVRRIRASLALVLTAGVTQPVWAADGALYDPAPPPGSAYLRVINIGDAPVDLRIGGQPFATAGAGAASDYIVTPHGSKAVEWKGHSETVALEAGKFYSYVLPGTAKLITDPPLSNRAKAMVRLYNLTGSPDLSLKTADGKVTLVDAVPAAGAGDRLVNGAKLALGVYAGTERLAVTPEVLIQRGSAYSVLAFGSTKTKVVWVESATRVK